MRYILTLLYLLQFFEVPAQHQTVRTTLTDTVLVFRKDTAKGFRHDYILFIPKNTPVNKSTWMLVEPNNTGILSDDPRIHLEHALRLATKSSVGNNVSTELGLPLLVPVFPRPASLPFVYTHALDRDVMVKNVPELERPDLQLLAMTEHAREELRKMNILTEPRFFMTGFSASATFTNRFSFLHPDKIEALAIGGFNGLLMLPESEIDHVQLKYPLGLSDFTQLFGKQPDTMAFRAIPQFIYMGAEDRNDAVLFDDAYDDEERSVVLHHIGDSLPERFDHCRKIYMQHHVNAVFITYPGVDHRTTSEMNLKVVLFFLDEMKQKRSSKE